jgi:hypothetical protein
MPDTGRGTQHAARNLHVAGTRQTMLRPVGTKRSKFKLNPKFAAWRKLRAGKRDVDWLSEYSPANFRLAACGGHEASDFVPKFSANTENLRL